jgi:E3 ubiquitin-protein ligase SHPRH
MTCSICIGCIEDKIVTKCKHSFCNGCLTSWLLTNNTCPECRYNIIEVCESESESDVIELEYNEELKSGVRNHELPTILKYRDHVEDEIFDLKDNLDNEDYIEEYEIYTEDYKKYEFEINFNEKFKIVTVNVKYDRERDFGEVIYDVNYKVKRNRKVKYNKIGKHINCKSRKYKLKNFDLNFRK